MRARSKTSCLSCLARASELSPMIEWVDWAGDPDDEDDEERVEVNFADGTMESYPMGVQLRQIWHEDAE